MHSSCVSAVFRYPHAYPQRHKLFSRSSSFFCFCNNVTPICLSDLSPTSALDLGRLSQILFFSRTSLPGALALKTCVLGHGHLGLCHGTRVGRWAMGLAVGLKHMCWTYASGPHTLRDSSLLQNNRFSSNKTPPAIKLCDVRFHLTIPPVAKVSCFFNQNGRHR